MFSYRNLKTVIITAAIAMMTTGCATTPGNWNESVNNNIQQAFTDAQATNDAMNTALTDDITAALLPPLMVGDNLALTEAPEPRFDIAAKRTSARAFFISLVKDTPYSMVVHPDVAGYISLQMKDVTIDEVLEVSRRVYGYEYRKDGMRYLVLGQGMQTRIFPVNYLNFTRKGLSDTNVSSGELTRSGGGSSNQSNASSSGNSAGIQVTTNSETNFWQDLKLALETLIGNKDERRVVMNPQAGLVIVRAMPNELDTVEDFLGITQETVNRQVMLEAKIIEVELNDSFQSGINWAALDADLDGYNILAAQGGGGTLLSGSNTSSLVNLSGNLDPGAGYSPIGATATPPSGSAATSAFGGIFSLAIKGSNFAAFVEMLESQGDVQVLSSPRVSTVNNQKAVIKVGGDEFFVTGVKNNQTSSGGTTINSPEVELEPFFSGIALDVTPHIDEDKNIILHIHPAVSNVIQRDKNFIVSGEDFTLPLPLSNIQESDNVVRAQSGQVIIIGGLMKEGTTETNASVPILGDIPLLGMLFKHKKLTRIKKELVIMLKPSVISHYSQWTDDIAQTNLRTQQLRRDHSAMD